MGLDGQVAYHRRENREEWWRLVKIRGHPANFDCGDDDDTGHGRESVRAKELSICLQALTANSTLDVP